ncbi:MFS general substrate transporter [Myriangium duriaei CBS 260.36]|uniref:MFS general substrate transporter n=1 Tax=Myriangium duriaei CBS 260.36 TaxID=1168546 RepID=A0A9P4J9K7_9PEZI|nr:MFS general substrate transporter [Myriangium duriaei CBS 260.36]
MAAASIPRPGSGSDAIELRPIKETNDIGFNEDGSDQARSSATIDTSEYPSGWRLIAIVIGLVLSLFIAALDSTLLTTAIPSITDEFGSIKNIAWYGSAYQVTNTAFQPAWGKAYIYFPLKRVFLSSIVVFELGNVVAALASNSSIVILGRVVSGVGGGGVITGTFIMITVIANPRLRPAYMGIVGVTFGCASVIGPLLGGVLTDGPGWRWCFWVNLPIGGVAAVIMFLFFSAPHNPRTEMPIKTRLAHTDMIGALLVTGALSSFVMAMHYAGTFSFSSPNIIGSLAGFGVMAVAFVINEYLMSTKALIQPHLLRKKSILLNLLFSFFIAGVFFPLLYILPVQFQSVNNNSAAHSGIRMIPLVFGVSVLTMLSNSLLTVWRHFNPLLVFGTLVGTVGVVMIYTVDAATSNAAWTGFELLTAAGVGIVLQIPMIANHDLVGQDDIASVTSLTLFAENVGTALFVASSEAAFTTGLISSLRTNMPWMNPSTVVDTGVTQLRTVFKNPSELSGILQAYLDGCRISHIVSLGCGVATIVVSLFGAWPAGVKTLRARFKKPHST